MSPSRLAAVGAALREHEEIVFAAATTGPTNVQALVICRDMPELYRYLTEKLGPLDGVERIESEPLLRNVKQLGTVRSHTASNGYRPGLPARRAPSDQIYICRYRSGFPCPSSKTHMTRPSLRRRSI